MIGKMAKVVGKALDTVEPLETMAEKALNFAGEAATGIGYGAVKAGKTVGKGVGKVAFPKDNHSWSRKFVPKTANLAGFAGITGVTSAAILADEGFKARNSNKLGYISYMDGPARMTSSQTTGALEAAKNSGSKEMFNEIVTQAMQSSNDFNKIDDFGATGDLVFALHNAAR